MQAPQLLPSCGPPRAPAVCNATARSRVHRKGDRRPFFNSPSGAPTQPYSSSSSITSPSVQQVRRVHVSSACVCVCIPVVLERSDARRKLPYARCVLQRR